jgi:hypothetical protein
MLLTMVITICVVLYQLKLQQEVDGISSNAVLLTEETKLESTIEIVKQCKCVVSRFMVTTLNRFQIQQV